MIIIIIINILCWRLLLFINIVDIIMRIYTSNVHSEKHTENK